MTDTKLPQRILIVDDEPWLLEELNDFLTLHGVTVRVAGDAAQALAMLAGDAAITVVLTDIRMPGLDGLDLANQVLRARDDHDAIEVVLMTGHGTIEDAVQAVRAGAYDFLRKPMVLDDMFAVLRRAHAQALRAARPTRRGWRNWSGCAPITRLYRRVSRAWRHRLR